MLQHKRRSPGGRLGGASICSTHVDLLHVHTLITLPCEAAIDWQAYVNIVVEELVVALLPHPRVTVERIEANHDG